MNDPSSPETISSTSSSLLERAKARDPSAWRWFVAIYSPLVYGWAHRIALQPADAADVMQEVFWAVAENFDQFRSDRQTDSFRGWLWTITRHKLSDHFRLRAKSAHAPGGTEAYLRLQQLPDQPPGSAAARDVVGPIARRALRLIQVDFAEKTWRAFWQTTVDGRAPADVAADLGMTMAGVYQAKSRVLRRLRQELQ